MKAGELAGVVEVTAEPTKPGRYKQLVTRAEISLDGSDDQENDASHEPTQRAVNPLPPEPRGSSQPTLPGTGEHVLRHAPTATIQRAPPAPKRRTGVTLFAAISLLIMVLGVWLGFASAPSPPPAPARELAPPPPPLPTARLVLRVTPVVPVDLEVDGRVVERQVTRRITLDRLTPNVPHRIRITADGYVPAERELVLDPGGAAELAVALTPLMGSVTLIGFESGEVAADRGEVDGARIVGIPLGETVQITVSRRGARRWSSSVAITSTAAVEVAVPRAVPRPRGKLVITSRPYAEVVVDGRKRGNTPVTLNVVAGKHKVVLKRSNGKRWSTTVSVPAGKTQQVSKRWRR